MFSHMAGADRSCSTPLSGGTPRWIHLRQRLFRRKGRQTELRGIRRKRTTLAIRLSVTQFTTPAPTYPYSLQIISDHPRLGVQKWSEACVLLLGQTSVTYGR